MCGGSHPVGSGTDTDADAVGGGDAVPSCPSASVKVSDADELEDALDDAEPGDVIRVADGRYDDRFEIDRSGTDDEPIWLCGSSKAVIDGGNPQKGTVLALDRVEHWRLIGFTVENGQKGIMVDGSSDIVLGGLTVRRIGDEAIHLRDGSVDNLIVGSTISETGLRQAKFGEGIYVGSAESNWCDVSSCKPDRSDRNRLVGNTITRTKAEAIDIKEGTSGGVVEGNTFDGSDLVAATADSWVDVKGNDWTIVGNTGTTSPKDGFQTHEIVDGWGTRNRFSGNAAHVDGPGYGIAVTPALGNVVACDNTASGAVKGVSNITCTE
ncbi:right-handed parallel beta-helix repeat-containing protein [Homoserinibacter gongjuensis]|uniref:Right handed beta helix domain-containing protein n=1 Tax=Homoserinibacter gongjuensis TaxID=1162968 RepID=A0ABQ6JT96_9MICO|nr:right-handed parallel beta-helix repeat-containing protein [Homoserinibacter gongjuensis]GMA90304.1 hypothetical protein GCM10025869_08330 [Homoserinibacter gongjuensis]